MFEGRFFELLIIFVLALVVLGPEKLPRVVSEVGRWVGRARAMARQFREQLEEEVVLEETRRTQAATRPRPEPPASPAPTTQAQPGTPEAHAAADAPRGAVPTSEGQHTTNAHPEVAPQPPPDTQWEGGHVSAGDPGPHAHANHSDAAPKPYADATADAAVESSVPRLSPDTEPRAQPSDSSSEVRAHTTVGPESHANPGASDSATRKANGTGYHEAYASPDESRMTPSAQPLNGSSTTSPHERGT
jgi:sec-independent protein translocase protein TatB